MSIDLLAAFLKTVGAFRTRHSGRTLGHHLLGTYALLKAVDCDEETCLAGGLHSIYGTDRFRTCLLDYEQDWRRVSLLFGDEAEQLAAMFATLKDRTRTINDHVDPSGAPTWDQLRLIEAANLLEQNGEGALDRWPRIRAVWEEQCERSDNGKSAP